MPPVDLPSSRDYYGMYNSRDFYKGTSFKMAGEWDLGSHYFNDEFIVTFISFNGALLSCNKSHLADNSNKPVLVKDAEGVIIGIEPNPYWDFVLAGVTGPQGFNGKTPELIRVTNDGDRDRIIWGYNDQPQEQWQLLCYIDDLRGETIEAVEVTESGNLQLELNTKKSILASGSVLPNFIVNSVVTLHPDESAKVSLIKTAAPKTWGFNFQIPAGKATKIEVDPEVEMLSPGQTPYVKDNSELIEQVLLKFGIPKGEKGDKGDAGDQNIYIGCEPPEDTSLIWYDPCENAINGVSSDQIVYEAYQHAGGTASKSEFELALSTITSSGSGGGSVDLTNYYNKEEIDLKLQDLEQQIDKLTNLNWIKAE